MNARILLVGESWNTFAQHTKGLAAYTTSSYEEGAGALIAALRESGHEVEYMPNHLVVEDFPYTADELAERCDAIIMSDIPADSFLLPSAVFVRGERRANRLAAIAEFVRGGGGLVMVGGYMSFSGFDGHARYGLTPLADVLPVTTLVHDDRIETPEGVVPTVLVEHDLLTGVPSEWPFFLGYNRTIAKADATTLMTIGEDPFLVIQEVGQGRSVAFTSDCSPHWGSPAFMSWPYYGEFWTRLLNWAAGA